MNRTLLPVAVVFGASSLLLIDSAIKGGAILVLAAFAAMLLWRDSAATRHLVWLVAIVAMLVVPVFSAILPQWQVLPAWAAISDESPAVELPSPTVAMPQQVPVQIPAEVRSPAKNALPPATGDQPLAAVAVSPIAVRASEVTAEVAPAAPSWSWSNALPLLWAIGFCVLIPRLIAARWMLWSHERRAAVMGRSRRPNDGGAAKKSEDPIVAAFEAACLQIGVRQRVSLLLHPERTMPVIWGILRCRLLLPVAARQWSGEQLRSVLLHELAHIKRRDTIAQLLAQIACAFHWFNPLVWLAARRMFVERERACDDLVLASGVRPSAYAEHLLEVATRLSPVNWAQAGGLAMARQSSLEGRLIAVLSEKHNRRAVSVAVVAIALAVGVGIAIPVAMLRATKEEVKEVSDQASAGAIEDAAAPPNELPRNSTASLLLGQWQDLEGRKTPLSEASIARLRVAIDKWVKQPTAKPHAALVTKLRDWQLLRAEHPVAEVAAWLDEIAAIHPGSLAFAIRSDTLVGPALGAERQAALEFGPAAENGLRAAWSRFPAREAYLPGDMIYSSLVIQNVSERTVEFECPHSLENIMTWEAKTADGRTIEAKPWRTTGTFPLFTWQLKPGAFAEIYGRGVAIGEGDRPAGVYDSSMLTLLQAKRGEQVTVHWKVREPVEMTTGAVSFAVVGIEDVPVWSTSQAGKWPLPGGVTMEVKQEIVHATDVMSTAILTWPMDKAGGAARHQIWLGGDAFAARDPWLLAWERGATVLWAMGGQMQSPLDFHKVAPTPTSLKRIDFSDPKQITETSWSYLPDLVPDAIRAEFAKGFLPLATTPRTPAHAKPSVFTSRAEDVRPSAADAKEDPIESKPKHERKTQ